VSVVRAGFWALIDLRRAIDRCGLTMGLRVNAFGRWRFRRPIVGMAIGGFTFF
jgi:hypothetical protein